MTFTFNSSQKDVAQKFKEGLINLKMPFFSDERGGGCIIEILATESLTPKDYFLVAQYTTKLLYNLDPNTFLAGEPHF